MLKGQSFTETHSTEDFNTEYVTETNLSNEDNSKDNSETNLENSTDDVNAKTGMVTANPGELEVITEEEIPNSEVEQLEKTRQSQQTQSPVRKLSVVKQLQQYGPKRKNSLSGPFLNTTGMRS